MTTFPSYICNVSFHISQTTKVHLVIKTWISGEIVYLYIHYEYVIWLIYKFIMWKNKIKNLLHLIIVLANWGMSSLKPASLFMSIYIYIFFITLFGSKDLKYIHTVHHRPKTHLVSLMNPILMWKKNTIDFIYNELLHKSPANLMSSWNND